MDTRRGIEEKTTEAKKWSDYSSQVCGRLSQAQSDEEHAKDEQKHAFLQERFNKLLHDFEKSVAAAEASAGQITALQR